MKSMQTFACTPTELRKLQNQNKFHLLLTHIVIIIHVVWSMEVQFGIGYNVMYVEIDIHTDGHVCMWLTRKFSKPNVVSCMKFQILKYCLLTLTKC